MRHAFGSLLFLLAAAPVAAQAEDEVKRVEPVVITATKVETAVRELGASVTVVNGDDFATYHYSTVDEALRNVPGLEVARSGSLGKLSTLSIRGANSNQVQVLVDGVRVKSPTSGEADLSDLSPDLIERIEVIRGPQSTLYGADAIGGVVNIITKKGKGPFSASVQQEAGNYDTLASRASVSGAWKILDYALSASHLESNGQFKNDNSDVNALNARLGLSLPWQSSVALIVRYNKSDTGLPVKFVFPPPQPVTPIIDPNQKQQSETLVMSLEAATRPVPWWESRARVSRYTNTLGFQDAPDPGFTFESPFRSQIDVERREAEWVNAFHVGKWSTSTVGLEYRREEGENKGVFKAATETWSVFVEEQLRLFDRLFVTGGFRVEDHSVFGSAVTGRGSIAYAIKEWGTRLRGSAGSGFRAPTINDLFFPDFSNIALQPERSVSWDAGVDQSLWDSRIRLGVTYFHTDFTDLIKFVPLDVFPFASVTNVGRARSQGLEFTSEVDLLSNLVASVNYTFTDSKDLATGQPLPRVPKHAWNLGVTWEPIPRLSLFTQLYIRSSQFDNFGDIFNRGYTRVDVGGTYRLLDRYGFLQALEITARVQNLFNEHYAEVHGFPALGTNVLAGLRARF
jgi:vitamin B12 transporter